MIFMKTVALYSGNQMKITDFVSDMESYELKSMWYTKLPVPYNEWNVASILPISQVRMATMLILLVTIQLYGA
jgi:hypothetical protein